MREFYYFNPLDSDQKIKADYKKLVLIFHPDAGGDDQRFSALADEYSRIIDDPAIPFKPYEGVRLSYCQDYHFLKSLRHFPDMPARFMSAVERRISELDNF